MPSPINLIIISITKIPKNTSFMISKILFILSDYLFHLRANIKELNTMQKSIMCSKYLKFYILLQKVCSLFLRITFY